MLFFVRLLILLNQLHANFFNTKFHSLFQRSLKQFARTPSTHRFPWAHKADSWRYCLVYRRFFPAPGCNLSGFIHAIFTEWQVHAWTWAWSLAVWLSFILVKRRIFVTGCLMNVRFHSVAMWYALRGFAVRLSPGLLPGIVCWVMFQRFYSLSLIKPKNTWIDFICLWKGSSKVKSEVSNSSKFSILNLSGFILHSSLSSWLGLFSQSMAEKKFLRYVVYWPWLVVVRVLLISYCSKPLVRIMVL